MPETDVFKKLKRKMMKEYLGEDVPKEYQDRYGTMYNKKDVISFATATAKKRRIPIDVIKQKVKGVYFKWKKVLFMECFQKEKEI